MRRMMTAALFLMTAVSFASDRVDLVCSAKGARLVANADIANMNLTGTVEKRADGYHLNQFRAYLEVANQDGSFQFADVSDRDDRLVNDPKYAPRTYKNHIRFQPKIGGEKIDLLVPEDLSAVDKVVVQLHGFHDTTSGTISLDCRAERF